MKCVIIPSIAVSMLPTTEIKLSFRKLSWDEFVVALKGCEKVTNFVRHKPTNDLIMAIVKFETGFEYKISSDDVIFMIGLATRAPVSGADVTVTPSDLLIYLAKPVE